MAKSLKVWLILSLAALLLVAIGSPAAGGVLPAHAAPAVTGYDLAWYSVDSGGAVGLSGGAYTLSGTTGQADAGLLPSPPRLLSGGFWSGIANINLFAPLVRK